MSDPEVYTNFIEWLGKTWWNLTESEHLMPLIQARYSPEEAAFLTGMPHSAASIEELAQLKGIETLIIPQFLFIKNKGADFIERDMSLHRITLSSFLPKGSMRTNSSLWLDKGMEFGMTCFQN